jgi:hypothetical protein
MLLTAAWFGTWDRLSRRAFVQCRRSSAATLIALPTQLSMPECTTRSKVCLLGVTPGPLLTQDNPMLTPTGFTIVFNGPRPILATMYS